MYLVVLACLLDVLGESVLDITVQGLNIEVHVVLVELFEHLGFGFNITVDTEKCRNLIILNVHKILVRQVL